jgi:hypothetical protein
MRAILTEFLYYSKFSHTINPNLISISNVQLSSILKIIYPVHATITERTVTTIKTEECVRVCAAGQIVMGTL